MKKSIKAIIAASAVATVVGIGTVSFAAWTANTQATATVEGEVGTIVAIGFDSALTATIPTGKTLVPYNQSNTDSNQLTVWSVELPTVSTTTVGAKLTVKYADGGVPTLNANSGIYVMLSTSDVTQAPSATTGYKKLSSLAQELKTFAAHTTKEANGYLVIILDSSSSADMGATFKIELKVEQTT